MKHILIVSTSTWDGYHEEAVGVYNKLEDCEKAKSYIESLRDKYKNTEFYSVVSSLIRKIHYDCDIDNDYENQLNKILKDYNLSEKQYNNWQTFNDNFQVKIKSVYHNKFDLSKILNVNEL